MSTTTLKKSDVFISYGRAESKAFASKLHNNFLEKGLDVWFDQNDIPLGIDFQHQIDDGIEKADNFVFIIAPHSLKSEFCLKEVLLAIQHKKRIIPVLHIEPKEKEIWDKMHPVVSKLNWVYMREEADENIQQEQWKTIDDFDKNFSGLFELINSHRPYVEKHTEVLIKALEWDRDKRTENYLLTTEELQAAEKWLKTKFKDTLPPCEATPLQADFICESVKTLNKGHTDVFFSYAREDFDLLTEIRTELLLNGITTWADTSDIKTGVKFEDAIRILDRQLKLDPTNYTYVNYKSIILKKYLKRIDEAIVVLKKYNNAKRTFKVEKKIASYYADLEDYENSVIWYKKAYEQKKDATVIEKIAIIYLKLDRNSEAITAYEDFIKTNPNKSVLAKTYMNLGKLYEDMKNNAKSIENYEKSIELKYNSNIVLTLIMKYYEGESYDKALEKIALFLKNKPGNNDAIYYRAMIHFDRGEKKSAKADFQTISSDPKYSKLAKGYIESIKSE